MKNRMIVQTALIAVISILFCGAGANLAAQQNSAQAQNKPGMDGDMPGMDMDHDMPGMDMGQGTADKDHQAESGAVHAMSQMHHHQMGPHMYMTSLRPSSPEDWGKADKIAQQLRESIEKYKDYHVALSEGFRIFMPNLPQPR